MHDLPAELAFDALDRRRRRRRAGGEHAHAARRTVANGPAAAFGEPMSTVGAAHSMVTCSSLISAKMSPAPPCRRQTCVPPAAVTVHVNVQPFAWNIGSVHR